MFNELSLAPVNSREEARTILEDFVRASILAEEFGFNEIRLHEMVQNIYQFTLIEGYRIDTWLQDEVVNVDVKDRFREIISTFPLITETELNEKAVYDTSEFHKELDGQKKQVFGLGAASIYRTLAISLNTHCEWQKPIVTIEHYSIDHDGIDNTKNVEVMHFSTNLIFQSHREWLENEQKEALKKRKDLWDNRGNYFPGIDFGTEVQKQLETIGFPKKVELIFDCLKKLNDFTKLWKIGGFNLSHLRESSLMDISGESDCTMQKYSVLRKFRLPNGEKAQFELHVKIPEVRIYFLPDETSCKIIVGYIGKHLRTCLHK